MTELEETEYGYRVALADSANTGDAASLLQAVRRRLRGRTGGEFGVLLDLRRTGALQAEAQEVLALSLCDLRRAGMTRQAVVVNSRILLLQARHLAREAGTDEICRYFDSACQEDWAQLAADWLVRSLEPPRSAPEPGEE